MAERKTIFEVVECTIETSIEDLVLFLAFHQPTLGVTPPIFEHGGKVFVPVGIALNTACLLEASVGDDASKKYLHIVIKREGIQYKFSDSPPESMDIKVYPIIHVKKP